MERDIISNLPDTIMDQILCCLPFKDAVKTSVLSTAWRYKWASISCLAFDYQYLAFPSYRRRKPKARDFASDIDRVLLLHSGPICKFKLSYIRTFSSDDIDKWIIYLSRHPINELVLRNLYRQVPYVVPACVSSFQNLVRLDLCGCELTPPPTFTGFRNLTSLNLEDVMLDQDVFENLISSCPMLDDLTVINIRAFDHFNINAPRLRCFYLQGDVDDITLKNTSCLTLFSGVIEHVINIVSRTCNLVKLLAEMPQIESLFIEKCFIYYLASGVVPEALPVPCFNLHFLSICTNLSHFKETPIFQCILRSAPNLRELRVEAYCQEGIINVWQADNWSYPFAHLRHVEIRNFHGKQAEIEFIEFMLLTSPILKRMNVKFEEDQKDDARKFEIVKQVEFLRRASPQAQIQIT